MCPHAAALLTVLRGVTVLPLKLPSPPLAVPKNVIQLMEMQTVHVLTVRPYLRLASGLASGLASNDLAQEHLQNIVV